MLKKFASQVTSYNITAPPLGLNVCPVTNVASGPARNAITLAISPGLPTRPSGMSVSGTAKLTAFQR
jgi:hypothetical protein